MGGQGARAYSLDTGSSKRTLCSSMIWILKWCHDQKTNKDELILILVGGSKRTQPQDIRKARSFWLQWRKENDEKE